MEKLILGLIAGVSGIIVRLIPSFTLVNISLLEENYSQLFFFSVYIFFLPPSMKTASMFEWTHVLRMAAGCVAGRTGRKLSGHGWLHGRAVRWSGAGLVSAGCSSRSHRLISTHCSAHSSVKPAFHWLHCVIVSYDHSYPSNVSVKQKVKLYYHNCTNVLRVLAMRAQRIDRVCESDRHASINRGGEP